MTAPPKSIAIIGAGLSGLGLALALHQQSVPCVLYELREANYSIGGSIILSPNALAILDKLGIYNRIKNRGYNFEILEFREAEGKLIDTYQFGSDTQFGYKALHTSRSILINEMTTLVKEAGIPVHYDKKFIGVLEETDIEVQFEFADGTIAIADLLIGADGIHSAARKYIHSDITPEFLGILAVTGVTPTSSTTLPTWYPKGVAVSTTIKTGTLLLAPQNLNGSEMGFSVQKKHEELNPEQWNDLSKNKTQLLHYIRADHDSWPDYIKMALDHLDEGKLSIWPIYSLPKLNRWYSTKHRVIILGGAAYTPSSTAGQNVNQIFEDTYSLSLLLSKLSNEITLQDALVFWYYYRQQRIDKILEHFQSINSQKFLPDQLAKLDMEEAKSVKETKDRDDLEWLYNPRIEEVISEWVNDREGNVKE